MIIIELELETPSVPNWIFIKVPGEPGRAKIALKELTHKQLSEIADAWTGALFRRSDEMNSD